MIAKEGVPALRRWPPSPCHVFCNGRLADNDAQLEQLAVNPWRSPQRVGNAHLANELADVHGRPWPAAARPSTLPASNNSTPGGPNLFTFNDPPHICAWHAACCLRLDKGDVLTSVRSRDFTSGT